MKLGQRINEFRYWLARKISPWVDDVDYRFGCVLSEVTSRMSKTNYTLEAMRAEIADKRQQDDELAVDDFLCDYEDEDILARAARVRDEQNARRERWARMAPAKP